MKDELKAKSTPRGSRSYHTSAPRRQNLVERPQSETRLGEYARFNPEGQVPEDTLATEGFKFAPPALPLAPFSHLSHRFDPLVQQVSNLIMKDGKRGTAQRACFLLLFLVSIRTLTMVQNMGLIFQHLRTSPPPVVNPARPLLPGAPPPAHLPLNPVLYLSLAIDSVAPLLKIRSIRGAAGGGVALQVPSPLGPRQRRRTAMMWILDAAVKRRNRGSGKGMLAQRIAEELIAVVEGRSTVWQRRDTIHKLAVSARANLNTRRR